MRYALIRNNSQQIDDNQSYLNNEAQGYNNINNSQFTISNENPSHYNNNQYKVISTGSTNSSKIRFPNKNFTPQTKHISINISEQSPSSFGKLSQMSGSSKGDLHNRLIRKDSNLSSKAGSIGNYEKEEISPVSEKIGNQHYTSSGFKGIILKKFCLADLLNNSSQSQQANERPLFMINFLKERYGKEKFNNLINKIEESEDPLSLLNDESQIKEIVGEDYSLAIKFLRYVIKSMQTNEKSNS